MFIGLAFFIFMIAFFGLFFKRTHMIMPLLCLELMLVGINIGFLSGSCYLDDILGEIFILIIIVVSAAESALGLSIVVRYYKIYGNITIDFVRLLKS
jgi:NADH-quinone oxidoreductase subunit K